MTLSPRTYAYLIEQALEHGWEHADKLRRGAEAQAHLNDLRASYAHKDYGSEPRARRTDRDEHGTYHGEAKR